MDAPHFDALTRFVATRPSRRQLLRHLAGGLALAAGLGGARSGAAAQGATPAASPATTNPTEILFVQSFDSGSFVPTSGSPGEAILTLTGVTANTDYFSERPQRLSGLVPTAQFIDGRAFDPTDPPNAALVAQTANGPDTLIVELRSPQYDAARGTATYAARVINNYQREGLSDLAQRQNDHTIAAKFAAGSLFVDDLTCKPDGTGCGSIIDYPKMPPSCADCCSGTCILAGIAPAVWWFCGSPG